MTVPTWRARDVTRPVDLVEEVARFRIEEVPSTLPERDAASVQLTREQRLRRQVEDILVGAGFSEAYTWSLVPAGEGRLPARGAVLDRARGAAHRPPHSALLESAERNRNAGVEAIALFEIARVYLPTGEQLPDERWHVGGDREGGFFRAKGAVETPAPRARRAARRCSTGRARSESGRRRRARRAARRLGLLRARPRRRSSPTCRTRSRTTT